MKSILFATVKRIDMNGQPISKTGHKAEKINLISSSSMIHDDVFRWGTSRSNLLAKGVSTKVILFVPDRDYLSVALADRHRLA